MIKMKHKQENTKVEAKSIIVPELKAEDSVSDVHFSSTASSDDYDLGNIDQLSNTLNEPIKQEGPTQNSIREETENEGDRKDFENTTSKCNSCDRNFSTKGNLKTHIKTHHNPDNQKAVTYMCEHCVAAFNTPCRLKKHIKLRHSPERNKENTSNRKSRSFKCDHCEFAFKTPRMLPKHCRTRHGIILESDKIEQLAKQYRNNKKAENKRMTKEKELAEVPVQCEVCSGIFKSRRKLRNHQRDVHTEKNFQCTSCVYKSSTQKQVDSHYLKVHTDLKKEECTTCGGFFNHLKEHYSRRHTERYREICNVCGDVFKNMRNHLKRTACGLGKKMEATIKCELCSKAFTLKHGLQRHIKMIHDQIKDCVCELCDYKTSSKHNLELHQDSMHKGIRRTKQTCPHCDKMPYKLDWHIKTYHSLD